MKFIVEKMVDKYIDLCNRLNLLGYTQNFPVEATSLIEILTTDLIQTTKSLQYYMALSKEAIQQRDSLKNVVEPYKCENLNLVTENNKLQNMLSELRSDSDRRSTSLKNKIVALENELEKCESEITKLKLEKRELKTISSYTTSATKKSAELRNKLLNRETINARLAFKSKKYCKCNIPTCPCFDDLAEEIEELTRYLTAAENRCSELEANVNQRNCDCDFDLDKTITKLRHTEYLNEQLSKKLKETVANQHEAMLRALKLADKNSLIENELKNINIIASQIETECNKILQEKLGLINELKKQIAAYEEKRSVPYFSRDTQISSDDSLEALEKKNRSSKSIHKSKCKSRSTAKIKSKVKKVNLPAHEHHQSSDELHNAFEEEKKKYEEKLKELTEQLKTNERRDNDRKNANDRINIEEMKTSFEKQNLKDFQTKICELETIISDVKIENRLLKDLVNRRCQQCVTKQSKTESRRPKVDEFSWSAEHLRNSNKDYESYNRPRCVENCRNDSFRLQKEVQVRDARIEMLLEENGMLKISRDAEKSSFSYLRSEIDNLQKTIKTLNEEMADVKCVNVQLKNLQKQTEKHMAEKQGELAEVKKVLKNSKVMIEHLEKRNKMLQEDLTSLTVERRTLKQNLSLIDGERDRLIVECDNKTEAILEKDSKLSIMKNELKNLQTELAKVHTVERDSLFKLSMTNNKFESVNQELKSVITENEHLIRENKVLQDKLASVRAEHLAYVEKFNKSNIEVDAMRQQLQVYVSKIKNVEDVLQSKEEEMKTLLENFSSLAQEATALEMTNNSLEHERALKCTEASASMQKITTVESQLKMAEDSIRKKDEHIAALLTQIKFLEMDISNSRTSKDEVQQREKYYNDVVNTLKTQNKNLMTACDELHSEKVKVEQHLDYLNDVRRRSEENVQQHRVEIDSLDNTLTKSRREIIDLKVSLQNAMTESKVVREKITDVTNRLQNIDFNAKESKQHAGSAIQLMMDLQKYLYSREKADVISDKSDRSSIAIGGRKRSI